MTVRTASTRRSIVAGVGLAVAALLGAGLAPTLAAEPSLAAPAAPTATILIVSLDSLGTDATDDDVLLDGSVVAVHADDGDGVFDPTTDALAFGPVLAAGGLLDTDQLGPGRYWVYGEPPSGYDGAPPILVDLNTDATRTCVWDAAGLTECQANDAGAEGLSWTMVLVRNVPAVTATPTPTPTPTPAPTATPTDAPSAPTPTPTGEVLEATGHPRLTLPPTDGDGDPRETGYATSAPWVIAVLISLSALLAAMARRRRLSASERRRVPLLD